MPIALFPCHDIKLVGAASDTTWNTNDHALDQAITLAIRYTRNWTTSIDLVYNPWRPWAA